MKIPAHIIYAPKFKLYLSQYLIIYVESLTTNYKLE